MMLTEEQYGKAMAKAAKAERERARKRDGVYVDRKVPESAGNPYLSDQRKVRAAQQRHETFAALSDILRHGEWMDTPTVAKRRGQATSPVNKNLNRMRKAGLVEKRVVSAYTGGTRAEWRLSGDAAE